MNNEQQNVYLDQAEKLIFFFWPCPRPALGGSKSHGPRKRFIVIHPTLFFPLRFSPPFSRHDSTRPFCFVWLHRNNILERITHKERTVYPHPLPLTPSTIEFESNVLPVLKAIEPLLFLTQNWAMKPSNLNRLLNCNYWALLTPTVSPTFDQEFFERVENHGPFPEKKPPLWKISMSNHFYSAKSPLNWIFYTSVLPQSPSTVIQFRVFWRGRSSQHWGLE